MTVTHTYTQEELDELFAIGEAQGELDEFLAIGAAQEEPAQIVAIHEAQAQEEVIALEEAVAAALEQAAGSQLQAAAGENTGKTHDCELCGKSFSRRADRSRHVNSVHFKIKAHICPFLIQEVGKEKRRCGKAYAQKTSLEVHMLTHKKAEDDKKPFMCCMALKTGLCCTRRFGDPSSVSRHRREQHKGATYQCPFPGCLDRAKNPKRIKRQSEFKKHLLDKHNLTAEELAMFQVLDGDDSVPIAGPSKPRKSTRKAPRRKRPRLPTPPPLYSDAASPAAHSSGSVGPPLYSAVPYAGELPAICTTSEDGYASTPGLTFCSPSPSPSVQEAAYEVNSDFSVPPPRYSGFESCSDFGAQPYPQEKDMSTYVSETTAGMGFLLPDSDLNNMSHASGLNYLSFDSVPDMSQSFDQSVFMGDKPGSSQLPYAETTNMYYDSGVPFELAYQLSGYEYSGEYAQWAMPVPEMAEPYTDQMDAFVPPSLPHYDPSPFDMYYNTRQQ